MCNVCGDWERTKGAKVGRLTIDLAQWQWRRNNVHAVQVEQRYLLKRQIVRWAETEMFFRRRKKVIHEAWAVGTIQLLDKVGRRHHCHGVETGKIRISIYLFLLAIVWYLYIYLSICLSPAGFKRRTSWLKIILSNVFNFSVLAHD